MVNSLWAFFMDIKHNPKPDAELGDILSAATRDDMHYKSLLQSAPIGIWEVDMSAVKVELDALRSEGIVDLGTYLANSPDKVYDLVDLARITHINQVALSLFKTKTKPAFSRHRKEAFTTEYPSALCREIMALAEGQLSFRTLTTITPLTDSPKKVVYHMTVVPGYEHDLSRVIVALTDISFLMGKDAFSLESEEIHRIIYHQAYIGIARISRTGRFMMVNKRFCDIVGYNSQELRSMVFFQLTHPDYETDSIRNWDILLSGDQDNFSTEEIYVHKNSSPVNVNISVTLIRNAKGKPDSYLAVYEDITSRKKDEQDIRKFSHAVKHSIDGIAITDKKGIITYANPATYALYGYDKNELIGKHIDLLNTADNFRQNVITPALKEHGNWHGELMQIKRDGSIFRIELSTSIIQDSEGAVIGSICIARDITAKKEAEEAFARNHNLLKAVFEGTSDSIFVKDTAGRYLMINSAAAKHLGTSLDEIKGKDDYDLFPEKSALKIREIDKELIKTGKSQTYETSRRVGNEKLTFSTTKSPFYDHEGKIAGVVGISRDISEKKKAEEKLSASEELFRSITENAPIFILKIDRTGTILYMNRTISGLDKSAVIGVQAFDYIRKKHQKKYKKKLANVFDNGVVESFEINGRLELYNPAHLQIKVAPIVIGGEVDSAMALIEDITEKKIAEEQLNESESRWRSIFEHAEDIIITVGKDKKVAAANRTLGELPPNKIIGRSYLDLIPKSQWNEVGTGITSVFETGQPYHFESTIIGRKGVENFYSVMVAPVATGKEVEFINAIIRDITELKKSEEAIMSAMIEGQDNERKRIARELHDGLGQNLSAVKMSLASLEAQIKRSNIELKNDVMMRVKGVINDAIQEVRNISHDLMPDLLEQFGIVSAMDELCEKSSGENLRITFEPIDMRGRLKPRAETGLYRITQELISNTVRHSMAHNVHIQLINHGKSVVLSVEDDGIGFDLKLRSKGIGLKNIESRVKLLSGELEIETTPGEGTLVTIEVPI